MSKNTRILIVDDQASIRFSLEETLKQDGHQVVTVASGEAALERITAEEFDLALIDLKLEGISGLEVLAALRERAPDTTAIVLTAYASLETAVAALRQGAHDYLFKPCKTVDLRESIRTGLLKRQRELRQRAVLSQLEEMLSTGPQDPTSIGEKPVESAPPASDLTEEPGRFLQRAGLIVDTMRHVITLDGHLLELSPTEFDLLAYLVSEAPRVVSPQELVREVQGYESEAWEARDIVRYHIYRIRRKMRRATGQADAIRTRRGVGYTIGE